MAVKSMNFHIVEIYTQTLQKFSEINAVKEMLLKSLFHEISFIESEFFRFSTVCSKNKSFCQISGQTDSYGFIHLGRCCPSSNAQT